VKFPTVSLYSSQASLSTKSQPKSIAVGEDGSVFLAEINGLEVVRDNQKTFELPTSFTPSAIDVHGSLVVVGGEVGYLYHSRFLLVIDSANAQDSKVRLYNWDSRSLKEAGLLEGNKGPISAIRFSPDGTKVVSGDVSFVNFFALPETDPTQSSGKLFLFDVKGKQARHPTEPK